MSAGLGVYPAFVMRGARMLRRAPARTALLVAGGGGGAGVAQPGYVERVPLADVAGERALILPEGDQPRTCRHTGTIPAASEPVENALGGVRRLPA